MKRLAALALAIAAPVAFAYDLNGVPIGGDEQAVKKAFPSAYCKPLEWSSTVADRYSADLKHPAVWHRNESDGRHLVSPLIKHVRGEFDRLAAPTRSGKLNLDTMAHSIRIHYTKR